ncbi:MAG TPA: OmpA family protein [Thermoanaerobaculia bacterium]
MHKPLHALLLCFLIVTPLAAQQPDQVLAQAQQVLTDAEQVGAATHATALLDDARTRLRYARENWEAGNRNTRDLARMRAMEALWAGRAALAKARWATANTTLRTVTQEITTLGGRADVTIPDEAPTVAPLPNATPAARITSAQQAFDRARSAGAEAADIAAAQEALATARRAGQSDESNPTTGYYAMLAELISNRAYYVAQSRAAEKALPNLQAQRTQLLESAGRREAAEERLRREQAEREAAELRQRLEAQAEQQRRAEAEAQQRLLQQQIAQAQAAAQDAQEAAAEAREENRRLRLEQELARLAATRTDPRGLIVTLPGIFFDTGKSQLKAGARSTLSNIARHITTDANLRVMVEGHTDSVGSDATNQRLSEQRANAVRAALIAAGIPADRITSGGRGEAEPVATNNTAAGRQQNRRVELIITQ